MNYGPFRDRLDEILAGTGNWFFLPGRSTRKVEISLDGDFTAEMLEQIAAVLRAAEHQCNVEFVAARHAPPGEVR